MGFPISHPADTSRKNLAAALCLLSSWLSTRRETRNAVSWESFTARRHSPAAAESVSSHSSARSARRAGQSDEAQLLLGLVATALAGQGGAANGLPAHQGAMMVAPLLQSLSLPGAPASRFSVLLA